MSGPVVIKIGGSTLGSADTTFRDIAELSREGNIPVVVHGGGAEASRWLEAMGIPSRFERGLRVTDAAVLPVVVAVFAGLVNKRIVSSILAFGAPAAGISGADGGLLQCRLIDPALGFVCEPVRVDPAVVQALHSAGIIPVISPIGFVPLGGLNQLVNVNADTVAGDVAAALSAERLIFLTDVDGVHDASGAIIPSLTAAAARSLLREGTISGGMIPKVEACLHAAELGVPVHIADGRSAGALQRATTAGTMFTPARRSDMA